MLHLFKKNAYGISTTNPRDILINLKQKKHNNILYYLQLYKTLFHRL